MINVNVQQCLRCREPIPLDGLAEVFRHAIAVRKKPKPETDDWRPHRWRGFHAVPERKQSAAMQSDGTMKRAAMHSAAAQQFKGAAVK